LGGARGGGGGGDEDGFAYSIAWEVDPDDVPHAEHLPPDLYCAPSGYSAASSYASSAAFSEDAVPRELRRPFFEYFEEE